MCCYIGACSNRWYRLTVCGWMIYDAIVAHNPSNFPLLEHLALPNLVDSTGWRAATLDRYQNAPKLHTLAFGGVPPINKDLDLWTRLTLLDVAQCNSKLKDVFEICSNLRELRFRQFETGLPIKLCSPPISAPFVEKLTLSLTQTFYAESGGLANVIFASITCPSLTSLFIEGLTGYEDKWPRDAVNDFISRSAFHLTTLSIKFVPLLDSDLIDFLHRLPSLVHLTVDDSNIPTNSPSPITSAFVQSLHAFPPTNSATNSSVLMKSLKTLSLTFGGPGTFNDRVFVDMVLSRWFSSTYADGYGPNTSNVRTTCLRSVVMRFTRRDVDQGIYRQLKYLSKEGMRVVVVGQAKT
ncbi:hypothetical protein BT96DRAFT_419267 [Gymnopus androsaceus JB14]|uniref:F-box domain-containing protein n=1 Tax=Gymnopus androsaceus JB14 TaxID=1447944 RepID=A0A6A4HYL5_9AGAR|nr:hypothetical protein BT96DRAFT_419267 [Gymnopus androsaceus JB14]